MSDRTPDHTHSQTMGLGISLRAVRVLTAVLDLLAAIERKGEWETCPACGMAKGHTDICEFEVVRHQVKDLLREVIKPRK